MMGLQRVRGARRRAGLATPGRGELGLGIGFGVVVGLVVATSPVMVSVALVAALAGLALMVAQARVESWARALMLLTAFTQPMNGRYFIHLPIGDALLVLTLGAYLLIRLRLGTQGRPFAHGPVLVGLSLLAVGGFIGALFEAPGTLFYQGTAFPLADVTGWANNMDAFTAFILGSFVPMALWALVRPGRAYVRRILGAFVAGCTVSVAFGYIVPTATGGGRVFGLALHSLQLGTITLVGVGAAVALLLDRRPFPVWGFFVPPLLVLGIVGSGSRSALGGLVVFACIIGPMTRHRAVLGALMAGAAVIILMIVTGFIGPEGDNAIGRTLGNDAGAQHSSEVRADLGERVFDRWLLRPITGNGFNHMRPSHNVYLGVLASAGVLGILGLGTIIGSIVRSAWRKRDDMVAVGATAGYLAYLAASYYDYTLWWRWLWFYVGLVVAVLATTPGEDEAEGAPLTGEPVASRVTADE